MEVDLFIISYGQVGGIICVLQTHFILKKSLLTKQLSIIVKWGGAYFFSSLILHQMLFSMVHFNSSNQLAMSLRNCGENLGKHDLIQMYT